MANAYSKGSVPKIEAFLYPALAKYRQQQGSAPIGNIEQRQSISIPSDQFEGVDPLKFFSIWTHLKV